MGNKRYYDELNIFRALIIIWVSLGHSTLLGDDFSSFNIPSFFHGYAYNFHMYAMFFLSGMLFANKFNRTKTIKDKAAAIFERFERLMVPYFFYTAVSYILKLFMEKYAYNSLQTGFKAFVNILFGLGNPNGGLWFLNSLFFISVIALLVNKVDLRITTFIAFILSVTFTFTDWLDFRYIQGIVNNSVYFFLGIMLMSSGLYEKISDRISAIRNRKLFSVVAALCLAASFAISSANLFVIQSNILKYILVYASIVVWYIVASAISINSSITKKITMCIGNYGMDIYMLGYYVQISARVILLSMLGLNEHICSFAMFALAIIVPIPISKYIIRKLKITNAIMLGDFKPLKRKKENEKA